jgi:hypothetical protein
MRHLAKVGRSCESSWRARARERLNLRVDILGLVAEFAGHAPFLADTIAGVPVRVRGRPARDRSGSVHCAPRFADQPIARCDRPRRCGHELAGMRDVRGCRSVCRGDGYGIGSGRPDPVAGCGWVRVRVVVGVQGFAERTGAVRRVGLRLGNPDGDDQWRGDRTVRSRRRDG